MRTISRYTEVCWVRAQTTDYRWVCHVGYALPWPWPVWPCRRRIHTGQLLERPCRVLRTTPRRDPGVVDVSLPSRASAVDQLLARPRCGDVRCASCWLIHWLYDTHYDMPAYPLAIVFSSSISPVDVSLVWLHWLPLWATCYRDDPFVWFWHEREQTDLSLQWCPIRAGELPHRRPRMHWRTRLSVRGRMWTHKHSFAGNHGSYMSLEARPA